MDKDILNIWTCRNLVSAIGLSEVAQNFMPQVWHYDEDGRGYSAQARARKSLVASPFWAWLLQL